MYYVDRQKYLNQIISGKKADTDTADAPQGIAVSAASEQRDRMEKAFRHMPLFIQHGHFGEERESLGRFFPHEVAGRTNEASMGLADGLVDMLEMPGDHVPAHRVEEARQRHERLCADCSLTEYYDRVCRHTRTECLAFALRPGQRPEDAPHGERFKQVISGDAFLFPLNNTELKQRRQDRAGVIEGMEQQLKEAYATHGARPENFGDYVGMMARALAQAKENKDVIGIHWNFSWMCSLGRQTTSETEVERIFARKTVSLEEYRQLQEHLAFVMARHCGELRLPVQIAVGLSDESETGVGAVHPLFLEEFVPRPELARTRFVLVHGGYPFDKETAVLARHANVWMDFSRMTWLFSPRVLAGHVREWLEVAGAKKMLFGVDGSGVAVLRGAWNTRRALALALSEMMEEHLFTEREAYNAARDILSANAREVYGLMAPVEDSAV